MDGQLANVEESVFVGNSFLQSHHLDQGAPHKVDDWPSGRRGEFAIPGVAQVHGLNNGLQKL